MTFSRQQIYREFYQNYNAQRRILVNVSIKGAGKSQTKVFRPHNKTLQAAEFKRPAGFFTGGEYGVRTRDLMTASHARSRLRQFPIPWVFCSFGNILFDISRFFILCILKKLRYHRPQFLWSHWPGSNRPPARYECAALPDELQWHA